MWLVYAAATTLLFSVFAATQLHVDKGKLGLLPVPVVLHTVYSSMRLLALLCRFRQLSAQVKAW